ncbi:hypothetical protein [Streptomyces sp. CB03911]|uniref:DUF6907 domain-containing protein n=1 Tax=Streptomyces sp. CB03911 TaxID=1804758 RepID=UPI00093909DB|nr:hypothetical protein [Streptomyces sp. CB03911]OKI14200.1 hypothetical protein A6A07_13695 [Streptomyces sp. CB03911]
MTPPRRLPEYTLGPLHLLMARWGLDPEDPRDVLLACVYRLAARLERRASPWDAEAEHLVDAASSVHLLAGWFSVYLAARFGDRGEPDIASLAGPARVGGAAARTVTVQTVDCGPVVLREPSWCVRRHSDDEYREDLIHDGPDVSLTVETEGGAVELLDLLLTQAPFAARTEDRRPTVAVRLGGDYHRFRDQAALNALADNLVGHAE